MGAPGYSSCFEMHSPENILRRYRPADKNCFGFRMSVLSSPKMTIYARCYILIAFQLPRLFAGVAVKKLLERAKGKIPIFFAS